MKHLEIRDFTLNQTAVTGKRKPEVVVDNIQRRYKIDPVTKQRTTEQEGFVVDIIALHGKVQSVKLPLDAMSEAIYENIDSAIKAGKTVCVNFGEKASTLRGRCYAMYANGQLLSGVSCTATEINIVAIEEPEADFDDIIADIE